MPPEEKSDMKAKGYALLSGSCGTVASMFGKLSGLPMFQEYVPMRFICFLMMAMVNLSVWTFYIKAMRAATSSLPITVISASSNYLLSLFAGFLFFGEFSSLLWWAGGGLVLSGVTLIITTEDADDLLDRNEKPARNVRQTSG